MTMHEAPDAVNLVASGKENAALNGDAAASVGVQGAAAPGPSPQQRYKLTGSQDDALQLRLRSVTDRRSPVTTTTSNNNNNQEEREPRRFAPVEPHKKAQLRNRQKDGKEPTPQPVVPDMVIECVLDQHGYVKTRTYRRGKFLGKVWCWHASGVDGGR